MGKSLRYFRNKTKIKLQSSHLRQADGLKAPIYMLSTVDIELMKQFLLIVDKWTYKP